VKGGTLAEPVAPVKAGSTFEGWYKEAELSSKINFPYDLSGVTADFTLYAKWTAESGTPPSDTHNISSASEWNLAIAAVNAAGNNKTHTFIITKSFELEGANTTIFTKTLAGLSMTIKGEGNSVPEISLATNSKGYLIYFSPNEPQTITLENIILKGHSTNNKALIGVGPNNKGELILGKDASITGNTNTDGLGGGIQLGGTVIVRGGEISANITGTSAKTNGKGGGVYMTDYGKLIMESGSIGGNLAFGQGGGVYIGFSANFTMKGGSIFGNTVIAASSGARGGGIYNPFGKFYMSDGVVTGYDLAHGDKIQIVEHYSINLSQRDDCNTVVITATVMGNYGAALYSQSSDDNFYGVFEGETFKPNGSLGSRRERDIKVIDGVLQE
jgi:uncharacterized repeat protein (TIGR02543 family)